MNTLLLFDLFGLGFVAGVCAGLILAWRIGIKVVEQVLETTTPKELAEWQRNREYTHSR